MDCDSVHRVNLQGVSNDLLFENCQWSDIAQTNIDVTTVRCDQISQYWDPAKITGAFAALLAAKCIVPGSPQDPETQQPGYVSPEQAAADKNKKITGTVLVIIFLIVISFLIYKF